MRLQDKVAVITGAASGIGLQCARLLVDSGAQVGIVDHDRKRTVDVAAELGKSAIGSL